MELWVDTMIAYLKNSKESAEKTLLTMKRNLIWHLGKKQYEEINNLHISEQPKDILERIILLTKTTKILKFLETNKSYKKIEANRK